MSQNIGIFLNQNLPLSEVFIAQQANAMQRYTPHILACRNIKNGVKHTIPTTSINQNNTPMEKVAEFIFKTTGYNTAFQSVLSNCAAIHAHFGPTGWLATPLATQSKKPLLVTLHGFDVLKRSITIKDDGVMQYLYKHTLNRLTNKASAFLCVSEFLKKRAIEFGFPEEKCHVAYMGIPLFEHEQPKAHYSDDKGAFRILAVGRLVPMKGHAMLIDAVAAARQTGANIALDIVGEGPLRDNLEQTAKGKLGSGYIFHGGQPHDRIRALMRQSHILCHLSHTTDNGYNEAFGLVILEAQWSGLPVIAFRSGGVPEGIADGKTGILCPENNIPAVTQSILRLMEDHTLRENMSHAAPEFIKARFDNKHTVAQLEKLYDHVIANHQIGRAGT